MGLSYSREDYMLVSMIVILLMISLVIWVSFCFAFKGAAKRFIAMRRQRQREALIVAALSRAASNVSQVSSIMSVNQVNNDPLPTYYEAISMRSLAPDSHRGTQRQSTTNRSNVSNHYAVSNYFVPPPTISQQHKQKTLLRIAPDRSGTTDTITLPPSYDSATTGQKSPQSNCHTDDYTRY